MPSFKGRVTEEELLQLIDYLKSIANEEPPARSAGGTKAMSYLREHTVKSWLLTTDHKRIGLLYLFTILFFFLIASMAAALMRIELLTPQGDLVTSETYNKLFTIHGVLMVWFFLVPAMPDVSGKFSAPADDRRTRRGLSRS